MPFDQVKLYDHELNDLKFLDLLQVTHKRMGIDFDKIFIVRLLKQVKLYATDEQHNF